VLGGVLVLVVVGLAFLYGQLDVASKSIQFDLKLIGRSVYEARTKNGTWPARIEDLAGTEYLKLPHRRTMLEEGRFVVVWRQDLNPNPEDNRDRVLAYDNSSLLSRFGNVWVCRGDLRVVYMDADELHAVLHPRKEWAQPRRGEPSNAPDRGGMQLIGQTKPLI
jgi:hypothetical protein